MAGVLQFKRSENVAAYTPKMGEPIFDISRKQFRIGNDVVAGGIVPKELFYTPITSAAEITAEADSCVIVDCRANSVKINLPAITALPSGSTVKVLDAYYAADKTNRIEVLSTAKINNLQAKLQDDNNDELIKEYTQSLERYELNGGYTYKKEYETYYHYLLIKRDKIIKFKFKSIFSNKFLYF